MATYTAINTIGDFSYWGNVIGNAIASRLSNQTVLATVSYTPAEGVTIETLTFAEGPVGATNLTANSDDNTIIGNGNSNTLDGGAGDDHILGGDGADSIEGRDDDDRLEGEGGDDTIDAGIGNDLLFGGFGNDRLFAAGGTDTMTGGTGDDRFFYTNPGSGQMDGDTITDFESVAGQNTGDSLAIAAGFDAIVFNNGSTSVTYGSVTETIFHAGATLSLADDISVL